MNEEAIRNHLIQLRGMHRAEEQANDATLIAIKQGETLSPLQTAMFNSQLDRERAWKVLIVAHEEALNNSQLP